MLRPGLVLEGDVHMRTRLRAARAGRLVRAVVLGAGLLTALGAAQAAGGDAKAGQDLFQHTCAVCHSTDVGVNKVGPSLWSVVGRKVASVPDYNYSSQMRAAAQNEWKVWDPEHLNAYLSNPRQVLRGVKMFYAVPDPNDRANVIAFLESLK